MTSRRATLAAGAALAAWALLASPASAHIQVRPTEAAPLDPTLWTVLVPNERAQATTRVELAIPEGVAPFSYADLPGWRRELTFNKDRSVRSIVWEGRLAGEGLAQFQFLATTPEQQGEIAWKALQTYENGQVVRWIGAPDSEEPASYTTVSADVPPQNAGGEGAGPPAGVSADPAGALEGTEAADDDSNTLPLVISIAAAVTAVAALAIAIAGRRRKA